MGEYTPTGFAASLGKQLQIVIISFKSWGFYFSCVWGGDIRNNKNYKCLLQNHMLLNTIFLI